MDARRFPFAPQVPGPGRLLFVLLALASVATVAAFGLRTLHSGVLPGLEVYGHDVGDLSRAELEDVLEALGDVRATEQVDVVRRPGGASITTTREEMGYSFDAGKAAEEIWSRGRQTNPIAVLADHFVSLIGGFEVDPVEGVDAERLAAWSKEQSERLSEPPQPGGIEVDGTDVEAVYPEYGLTVTPDILADAGTPVVTSRSDRLIVEARSDRPPTSEADVAALVADAERALSGRVTLRRGDGILRFPPARLGSILESRAVEDSGDVRLELHVRPARLRNVLTDDEVASVESAPVDARFELEGGSVRVVRSRPGFRFSARKAARQVVTVASRPRKRTAQLRGDRATPEFTTADARALNITERVSTFTTNHSCCEPRVQNIHRIAELVRGAIVEPGETFSLNDHVGPRTTASGFVPAPSIRDGQFVQEVGGGISQFATTMFNAIFFGGYDFLEYQPHSYYIDRYPRGREATISTPAPDLEFRNDSDAGIYIHTSYTDTSITVTFFGSQDVEVEAIMGDPFNVKRPRERCERNRDLGRREERVVSSGRTGFDVVVKRVFVRPNGERETEEFFTRYNSEPRVVQRRRC